MNMPNQDRVIVDPPILECPHCGGTEYGITTPVSGTIRELRSMRTGELVENNDLWDGVRFGTSRKHITCADCHRRIGTVVGTGSSFRRSDEPVLKTVRISTLCVVEKGRLMLVRKAGLDMFILPGGKQELRESDEAAMRREVKEELGCRVVRPKWLGVFRDAAGGVPGVEVEVTIHSGRLIGTPRPHAEIEEIRWVDMRTPEVPVAPSLTNLIMPYLLTMQDVLRS